MSTRTQYIISASLVSAVAAITVACAMFGKPTLTPEKICERVMLSESTVDVCASRQDLQRLQALAEKERKNVGTRTDAVSADAGQSGAI